MADQNDIDPFESLGGGVRTADGKGWLMKGMADPTAADAGGKGPMPVGYADSNAGTTPQGQGAAASGYSNNPTGAPTAATSNQGTQDVVRNTLLKQATQDGKVDTNDPTFRAQADTYAAAAERSRRNANDQNGETNFAANGETSGGYGDVQRRAVNETAAQNTAGFEASLAQSELAAERQQIQQALSGLYGMVDADQARALQERLANLDAAIRRESLASSSSLASQDIGLRRELGFGGLNLDALRLATQNDQFNNQLGLDASYRSGLLNNQALSFLLG